MEDVLLPVSFSCSTPSSEDPDDDRLTTPQLPPQPVVVRSQPKEVYNAAWAASAIMFLAVLMCISIIVWYIFTDN